MDLAMNEEDGDYQASLKATTTFRRKIRDSVLSPNSMRAGKLNKIKDEAMYEKVQMMDLAMNEEDDDYQASLKATATFRRKIRDSVLSPNSMRAGKLNKIKDEAMYEKVQMMIRVELNLIRAFMEKEISKPRRSEKSSATMN
ncbi:hypothetical protein GOP47_0029150 [Adiantum capillus-veneris]|nr:hypothetical protein GOP47_0029150 [Adiantum capillus-veneris]